MPNNKDLINTIALILLGVLIGLGGIYLANEEGWLSFSPKGAVSAEKAGQNVLAYINDNLLKDQGITASLVEPPTKEGTLYKVTIQIENDKIVTYVTPDGKLLFPQVINLTTTTEAGDGGEATTTLGGFSKTGDELCQEDQKPVVYFFGSQSCLHCQWEHPVVEEVLKTFEGYVSFHNNMNSDKDGEVFSKYSVEGYIPAIVLGCRYSRVGSGENMGEDEEKRVLTALICDLTGGQPAGVCSQVQDLINQINE